ncbi:hypothetical protein JZ751_026965 [Albula glossodonta]|uniref:C3/C5 convertase n=1 Tax=Albula glossodonta TaxID=121402 RepID=A0A8T2NKP3_9TELE|nr:hypothetical protein JZ751_026965 [Albula glossodonta]
MGITTWGSLLSVAFLSHISAGSVPQRNCSDTNVSIKNGSYILSNGLEPGSMLVYNCDEGFYPSPTLSRRCHWSGRWNPPPDKRHPTECKPVTCPDPNVFENGMVHPNALKYYVGNETTYECSDGYKLWGSKTRVCQLNGKWSGSTPICDSGSGHCPDPGIPPGGRRTGHYFGIDDKVTYRCDQGLTLTGSKERVCQESGEWTGAQPACYHTFTYDTPEEVTASFAASLRDSLTGDQNGTQHEKRLRLDQGDNLHIYIALDYSDSVLKNNFDLAKECVQKLIEKISYFEITPKYELLAFATDVKEIVSISNPNYADLDILTELGQFQYDEKGDKSGTNIAGAFKHILERMAFFAANNKNFKDIQHVIIMFTDGNANMGGNADPIIGEIRSLLDIKDTREKFLDIYVFGIGPEVNKEKIDGLVSKKSDENHFFVLKNLEALEETFDKMIEEGDSVGLCGLYRSYSKGTAKDNRQKYPWLAKVQITRPQEEGSNCLGALVSARFVLTAAHCFRFGDKEDLIKVYLDDDSRSVKIKRYRPHPKFNPSAKKDKGINEFYDYDVALVELQEDVTFSIKARPMCIPCTEQANRALHLSDKAKCKDHEDMLLKKEFEPAQFMGTHDLRLKNISLKLGDRRPHCIEDVKKAKDMDKVKDANDVVTINFLCSGGIEGDSTDNVACKGKAASGDSGGAVFIERKRRLFQVGVVSFGVKNLCLGGNHTPDSDRHSRDFHINLFKVLAFLKEYLGDGTQSYTPLRFID